ncbi:hypothetical protein [Humidesulfovibrio sp.]|uniref:hypothetical protein n=1 Tax=Humidesulfovibrio sp. TaxID=2910988 RepID=UPI002D7FE9DB|nr:hypothetical protein [Humidesulfovibrio sp.]
MKMCKSLLMSAALLVVFATSSFALTTVDPYDLYGNNYVSGTDTVYNKGDGVNVTFGSVGNPAAIGNGGVIHLDVMITLKSVWDNVGKITAKFYEEGSGQIQTAVVTGSIGGVFNLVFNNIPEQTSGIYSFLLHSEATGKHLADWTLNFATLKDPPVTPSTPIPAAFLLLGSGLLGLFGVNKSRKLGKGSAA